VRSLGQSARNRDTGLFPSLYLRRSLGENLQLNFSYSRRIERPELQELNPVVVYSSSTNASSGNPVLKPETTDAFEARLEYTRGDQNLTLTLYDRQTAAVWSQFSRLIAGNVTLQSPINAGGQVSRGAEISWRAPLAPGWKYVLTTNLFSRRGEVLDGGVARTDDAFAYSGNGQIEYTAKTRDGADCDQFQLAVGYLGPQRLLQGSSSGFARADFFWRRPLTERISTVLSVTDFLNSSRSHTRLVAQDLVEDSASRGPGPTLKLALSYRFGAKP
jgi:outer membrane receptor protein involved in Fe transport